MENKKKKNAEIKKEEEFKDFPPMEEKEKSIDEIENAPDDLDELFEVPPTLDIDFEEGPTEDDLKLEEMDIVSRIVSDLLMTEHNQNCKPKEEKCQRHMISFFIVKVNSLYGDMLEQNWNKE